MNRESIKVTATPTYQGESIEAEKVYHVWSYDISVENNGDVPIKIIGRHWRIIDGSGIIHEISSKGVVGQKPIIKPGEVFEYTSYANLQTSSGVMIGKYEALETLTKHKFDIEIPAFSLDNPEEELLLN